MSKTLELNLAVSLKDMEKAMNMFITRSKNDLKSGFDEALRSASKILHILERQQKLLESRRKTDSNLTSSLARQLKTQTEHHKVAMKRLDKEDKVNRNKENTRFRKATGNLAIRKDSEFKLAAPGIRKATDALTRQRAAKAIRDIEWARTNKERLRISATREARLDKSSAVQRAMTLERLKILKTANTPEAIAARALKKMSKNVIKSFSRMHGAFQRMVSRLQKALRTVAFSAFIYGGIAITGVTKAFGILREFEASRVGVTSMLLRLSKDGKGPFADFGDTKSFSVGVLRNIEKRAIASPASSTEIFESFQRIAPSIAAVGGLSVRDMLDLAVNSATSEKLGRFKTGTVGQDIRQLLTGQIRPLGIQEPILRRVMDKVKGVLSKGDTQGAFSLVRDALDISDEMKNDVATSFEGLLTTLQDKGRIFARTVFRPVFEQILKDMGIWNDLISNNMESVRKLSTMLAIGILETYFYIKEKIKEIFTEWKKLVRWTKIYLAIWAGAQGLGVLVDLLIIFKSMVTAWKGIVAWQVLSSSLLKDMVVTGAAKTILSAGSIAGMAGIAGIAGATVAGGAIGVSQGDTTAQQISKGITGSLGSLVAASGIAGLVSGGSFSAGALAPFAAHPVVFGGLITAALVAGIYAAFEDAPAPALAVAPKRESRKQVDAFMEDMNTRMKEVFKIFDRDIDKPFEGDNITVNIDATGSSIVVYQTLNTDNPVRVAGAALESAYNGIIQQSSGSFGLGTAQMVP